VVLVKLFSVAVLHFRLCYIITYALHLFYSYLHHGAMSLVARPPGVFEFENFAKGTKSMMDAIVESTAAGTTTIIG